MAVRSAKPSPLASLIAQLGIQAERIGASIVSELRELMVDAFHQQDRQNQRLSHYFLQLWKNQDQIIAEAMTEFFNMNGSKAREMIDQAISGLSDKKAEVKGYFIGLLMTALLNNRKVIDDNFVDHSSEFSYLVSRLVTSTLGAEFQEKFNAFADYCQSRYNQKTAEQVSAPSRRLVAA